MQKARKKPGEVSFALFLTSLSLVLLYHAYGISRLEALSAPGSFPLAVTATMCVTAAIVLLRTLHKKESTGQIFIRDLLPPTTVMMILLIIGYAVLLEPFGFLPTSLLFLLFSVKFLYRRSILNSAVISAICLAIIYVIFRLVFSVLMPEGVVPEREILAWFGSLL